MNKLLDELKKEMTGVVNTIQEENIEEVKMQVDKYFQLATVMVDLMGGKSSKVLEKATENPAVLPEAKIASPKAQKSSQAKMPTKTVAESIKEKNLRDLASSFDKQKEDVAYEFSRKLSGGFTTNDIFVPETVVRSLGLEDGDMVSAEPKIGSTPSKTIYEFKIVSKNTIPRDTGRREFNRAIVEYDESLKLFFVQTNIDGETLRVNDVPIKFYLSQKDVSDMTISTGDIVDVSWYDSNFNKGKVYWRYRTNEFKSELATAHSKMLNRKGFVSVSLPTEKEDVPQTLLGKKICVIGAEIFHPEFKEIVESHGGVFLGYAASTNKTSRTAGIKRADLVLVGIKYTSHEASQHANAKAKEYGIPFKAFSSFGKGKFLSLIYKELKIKE